MKVVIAGGRDYRFTQVDIDMLNSLHAEHGFTDVFSGGATGADAIGEFWAKRNGLPVKLFPALWSQHGYAAGPIRNREMAKECDAVVLFPGGKGTDNMRKMAIEYGRPIL